MITRLQMDNFKSLKSLDIHLDLMTFLWDPMRQAKAILFVEKRTCRSDRVIFE